MASHSEAKRRWREGFILSGIVLVMFESAILFSGPLNEERYALALLVLILPVFIIRWTTRKVRHRKQVLSRPFPPQWETILQRNVGYYNVLSDGKKARFRNQLMIFLDEVRITGIQTEVDDRLRILVASSAIIPILGYEGWEYRNLGEILIFPGQIQNHENKDGQVLPANGMITGQVSNWQNHQVMKLSKPALIHGFSTMQDRQNVGIHEFAHVLDDADGKIDGVPASMLPPNLIRPWTDLMHVEMEKIRRGKSLLRPYGATNEAEFFAVATEYFFEHPQKLRQEHPELYSMLQKIFQQDTHKKYLGVNFHQLLHPYGDKIGRNEPCPCGSKKKYKKCCLD